MNAFDWSRLYFRNEDASLRHTKATMAALFTYADFNDLTCYPSQRTLARVTGSSVDTVSRHIKKNVESGWLKVVQDARPSEQRSAKYLLTVPPPRTDAGSPGVVDALPAGMRGDLPAAVPGPSPQECGDPPRTGAALTTHVTTHEPSIKDGSSEDRYPDPWGSDTCVPAAATTTHVPTPRSPAGSPPRTSAGRSTFTAAELPPPFPD